MDGCTEVLDEIDRWNKNYVDVDNLLKKYAELNISSAQLKHEVRYLTPFDIYPIC